MMPVRIQRKRVAGYNMHAASAAINGLPCVSVTRPSRWGNPYDVRRFGLSLSLALFENTLRGEWDPTLLKDHSDELCNAAYKAHSAFMKRLGAHPLEIIKAELGGRNLACYCKLSEPCHADILLRRANRMRQ
jgi:Domain of unknown function (DUF4326)